MTPKSKLAHLLQTLIGLGISLAVLAIGLLAIESYFRARMPFVDNYWPSRFDVKYGWTFKPGDKVRLTNNVDYWQETPVNSLGFLDSEPEPPKHDACRVAILGDSFIEAAQVPISAKVQTQLERLAERDVPGRDFQVYAFGYSGTGQANQVPFYDEFARQFRPQIVVLVAVVNDFANNSHVLEAVRNGWNPAHNPRRFYRVAASTGTVELLPIDADWDKHQLSVTSTPPVDTLLARAESYLLTTSRLFRWAHTHAATRWPNLRQTAQQTVNENPLVLRMGAIERLEGYTDVFSGWNYPDDLDYDHMFRARELPTVFSDALRASHAAFSEFKQRSIAEQFHLVVLANHKFGAPEQDTATMPGHRPGIEGGWLRRLEDITSDLRIPVINQFRHIVKAGGTPEQAHFSRDGHWSPQGHLWAAEALVEYLKANLVACEHPGADAG